MRAVHELEVRFMSRDQLLTERRSRIGSSDAAACCGLSSWSDPLKVFARLVTEMDGKEWTFDESPDDALRFGNLLEPVIAAEYARRTGRQIRKAPVQFNDEFPWSVTHCDYLTGDGRILEVKNYSSQWETKDGVSVRKWGADGSDEVPDDIRTQCIHQARDTGLRAIDVAVLFGGNRFCTYTVEWDQELADLISAAESDLYLRAVERRQPEPDFARPWTLKILQLLNPVRTKSFCFLENCEQELSAFQHAKEQVAVWDQLKDAAQAKIVQAMGDAESAKSLSGWRVKRGRNFLVTPRPGWGEKTEGSEQDA